MFSTYYLPNCIRNHPAEFFKKWDIFNMPKLKNKVTDEQTDVLTARVYFICEEYTKLEE